MDKWQVVTSNNTKLPVTGIIKDDPKVDYVIFKVDLSNASNIKPLPIASSLPRIGEKCFAIGNPMGLNQTLSTGDISGYRYDENRNRNLIQTDAPFTHGSSGGALFNSRGGSNWHYDRNN